jgi:hypothetical protein
MNISNKVKKMKNVKVTSARGAKGCILHSGIGTPDARVFFRVYDKDLPNGFIDYDLMHSDIFVTLDADCEAAFYTDDEGNAKLDHEPDVLGIKVDGWNG